ncbi:ATP-binding protein [Sphingomonas sp. FW199]|uniref:ATP-binding protein n=1 Tax=Sphingomonas sp. FW199 TaxID=3400217 RepID=UPI003CF8B20B
MNGCARLFLFLTGAMIGMMPVVQQPAQAAPAGPAATQSSPATTAQLVERARSVMASDPEQARTIAVQAAGKARAARSAEWLVAALGLQAEAALRMRHIDQASKLIEEAVQLTRTNRVSDKTAGDLKLTSGGVRTALGDVAGALADYQGAHRAFVTANEARSQAIALVAIGSLYREAADYEAALKYYRQALEAYDEEAQLSVFVLNNRGNVLREMGRSKEAVEQLLIARQRAQTLDNPTVLARVLGNLARAQRVAGQLEEAQRSVDAGLALLPGDNAAIARRELLNVAARVALDQGRVQRAIALSEQSLAGIDPETSALSFRDAHLSAYLAYSAAGDSTAALVHLKALNRLDEQATKLAISTKTALMGAQFDFQNQELQIARLKAEELRRNVEFERARRQFQLTLFIGIAIAVAVLIGLLSFGVVTLRRSRNQVRATNVELGRTNSALEKALAAKTEFLATTSHEIRTPLNGILGMTQVMLADQRLDSQVRDRINVVHGAGVTMRALVDDILDVAKMETGNLTIEQAPMDLPATLTDVSRLWQEQARAKGLGFDLTIDPALGWIESDPARLRQMVFNLLSNAIKFTETGSVALAARATGDRLVLTVRDTGIGIAQDKLGEVFESFKQADSGTTRKFGGTGLGLSICRNLARALGGDVVVDSVVGEGSVFTVDLPLVAIAAPKAAEPAVQVDGGTGGIMIVERNPVARSMLKTLMAPRFGAPGFATTVDEAVATLGAQAFRAVLADETTLTADGTAIEIALERILAAGGGTPVLLLAQPMAADRRAALCGMGQVVVMERPVAGAAVVTSLQRLGGYENNAPPLVSQAA